MQLRLLIPLVCWWVGFFAVLGWKPDLAYNAQRYFEWLLLGSLLILGAAQPIRLVWGKALTALCVLLGLLALWVVLAAPHGWLAWRYLLGYTVLFLAVLSVAIIRSSVDAAQFDRAAGVGVVCLCFGASLIATEGLIMSLSIGQLNPRIIFNAFVNVRMLAGLQFATILLLPAISLTASSRGMRVWTALTAILWWFWLFFSGTRATLVVIPWALLVTFLCAGRQGLPWFKRLPMQLVGGLVLFVLARLALHQSTGTSVGGAMTLYRPNAGTSGRLGHWTEAWQHFLQHPWLGNGPGSYACFTHQLEATPHNIFFLLISGWGGPTVLLLAILALWGFVSMLKRLRQEHAHSARISPLALSLFATVVAIVTAAQGQGILISPLSQMAVVLVVGWAWSLFAPHHFVESAPVFGRSAGVRLKRVLLWGAIPLMLAAWLAMAHYDIALQKHLLISPDGQINLRYGPGYWADGHDHCPGWHQRYYGGKAP